MNEKCPNGTASRDKKWMEKSEEQRAKPCSKCKGTGHWHQHHKKGADAQQRAQQAEGDKKEEAERNAQTSLKNEDCKMWSVGKCKKGDKCPRSHRKKEGVPIDQDCPEWLKGHCEKFPYCRYNHPKEKKGSKSGNQQSSKPPACRNWKKGHCKKGKDCNFSHDGPKGRQRSTTETAPGQPAQEQQQQQQQQQ